MSEPCLVLRKARRGGWGSEILMFGGDRPGIVWPHFLPAKHWQVAKLPAFHTHYFPGISCPSCWMQRLLWANEHLGGRIVLLGVCVQKCSPTDGHLYNPLAGLSAGCLNLKCHPKVHVLNITQLPLDELWEVVGSGWLWLPEWINHAWVSDLISLLGNV